MMPNFLLTFASDIFFFFLFFLDLPFSSETFSEAMYSWFVYQNIDLFSLYISTLALLVVRFFSFSPLPESSPDGPSLSQHRLARQAVVGSNRDKRGKGQYCVWEFLCRFGSVGLRVRGEGLLDWSLSRQQNFQQMGSFAQHKKTYSGWNVVFLWFRQANIHWYWGKADNKSGFYFVSLVSLLLPLSEHCVTKT